MWYRLIANHPHQGRYIQISVILYINWCKSVWYSHTSNIKSNKKNDQKTLNIGTSKMCIVHPHLLLATKVSIAILTRPILGLFKYRTEWQIYILNREGAKLVGLGRLCVEGTTVFCGLRLCFPITYHWFKHILLTVNKHNWETGRTLYKSLLYLPL